LVVPDRNSDVGRVSLNPAEGELGIDVSCRGANPSAWDQVISQLEKRIDEYRSRQRRDNVDQRDVWDL
jgi:hypothetical protein